MVYNVNIPKETKIYTCINNYFMPKDGKKEEDNKAEELQQQEKKFRPA